MKSLTVVATRYMTVVGVVFGFLDLLVRVPWFFAACGFVPAAWSVWTRWDGRRPR